MSWYYSQGNERVGPVTDDEWRNLIASGKIEPHTLVWREGMSDWKPFAELDASKQTVSVGARGAEEASVCAECGKAVGADDLVPIGGRKICSACKPTVLQRLKEGAAVAGSEQDPEAVVEMIRKRGYEVRIGDCIRSAVALVKRRFWLCVGTTFLLYLVMAAAGAIPCLGIIGSMIINGPVIGGLYWFFLKMIREGDATIGDGFAGFNREFVQLMLCTVVSTLIMVVFFVPVGILAAISGEMNHGTVPVMVGIAYLVAIIPMTYLGIAWLFAPALIIDKRFPFWPALETSRRVVNLHWFRVFALPLVLGLVISGIMIVVIGISVALGVGAGALGGNESATGVIVMLLTMLVMFLVIFLLMPIFFAAITYLYEDIFGNKRETAPSRTEL